MELLCDAEIELEVRADGRRLYTRRVTLTRIAPDGLVVLSELDVQQPSAADGGTILAVIEATATGLRCTKAGAAAPALGYLLDLSLRTPGKDGRGSQGLS